MSSTMPVPLLIAIAPNRGDQPSLMSGRTCGLFNVYIKQLMAMHTTKAATMKGMGVRIKGISNVDTVPTRSRVTKSPRQEAIAGAILSGSLLNFRQSTMRVHIKEPRIIPDSAAAVIAVDATIINLLNTFRFIRTYLPCIKIATYVGKPDFRPVDTSLATYSIE